MQDAPSTNHLDIGWAAAPKWPNTASSDLVAIVPRLDGSGMVLMIDVQGSSSTGKHLARQLMRFARELADGGTGADLIALATSQHLASLRESRVSAAIHVLTVERECRALEICGYGICAFAHRAFGEWSTGELQSESAGNALSALPIRRSIPIQQNELILIANDGVARVGDDLLAAVGSIPDDSTSTTVAQEILKSSIALAGGRAKSDMAIAVFALAAESDEHRISHASQRFPLRSHRSAI